MSDSKEILRRGRKSPWMIAALGALLLSSFSAAGTPGSADLGRQLKGFDTYVEGVRRDWNVPGVGVGIVIGNQLVFAKGYGYRDYDRKLPFTPRTLFPIGSNTKLFTAVAAGMLVAEGKLTYDSPVRDAVPSIRFYNDDLNDHVTLRDMLAHRTGITRHDSIWFGSDFTAAELFEKLRYLEPAAPMRQTFLYNNMMYAAAGHIIEMKSGSSFAEFVGKRILEPLEMGSTLFSVAEMQRRPDHAVPYNERRDSSALYQIPYYEEFVGLKAGGAIISNLEDLSHWVSALMNGGEFGGKHVIPELVLAATLEPTIALPNSTGEDWTGWDVLNATYGMARFTAVYRGHLLTYHGGHIDGYRAQISYLPRERIGVIVLVIGDHTASLYDAISYTLYDRLLGLPPTAATRALLAARIQRKVADRQARSAPAEAQVRGTSPSHPLANYVGDYENAAYGVAHITLERGRLEYRLNHAHQPLIHVHYDRFDTPDEELDTKQSINFSTSPRGDIDRVTISLDEGDVVFVRKAQGLTPETLSRLAGTYEDGAGTTFQVQLQADGKLLFKSPGNADMALIPYLGLQFHVREFADTMFEFIEDQGRISALRRNTPVGTYVFERR